MQSTRRSARALFVAMVLILGLLLPGPIAAKKDYLNGKILDAKYMGERKNCRQPHGPFGKTDVHHCKYYNLSIQVEDMTYIAEYEHEWGRITEYDFKESDWPVNADVEVRFDVKHLLGLRHTYVFAKRPNGKEIEMDLVSKTGPDGKELCGNYRC